MKKLILILFLVVYSSSASAHWIEALLKAGSEAAAEASAVKAAAKTEKAAQVINEANTVRKTGSHVPSTQVLFATNQIIKECEKAKKNADKGLCGLQKDKINTCLEARLNSGFVMDGAVTQCKAEIN